ncbi:hypothetical protein CCB80_03655 [Armatimonadetes bacterium Uphvl-Ar1]|nr:hypothetical protein CCB80_03655 [Armatimonadetes bacterium Uphvl-Ar1]
MIEFLRLMPEIFGAWMGAPVLMAIIFWMNERPSLTVSRRAFMSLLAGMAVSCHGLLRYLSWAVFSSVRPESEGLYRWFVNDSDWFWCLLLVGLTIWGLKKQGDESNRILILPRDLIALSLAFWVGVFPLVVIAVLATLVS